MAPKLTANLPSNLDQFATTTNLKAQSIALFVCTLLISFTVIVPLIKYAFHKNLAACTLICWLLLGNLFTVINAIIWHNDDFASWYDGVGLCDLEAKLYYPIFVGIPAAILGLTRNPARCMNVDSLSITTTKQDRLHRFFIDCTTLYLVPVLQIGLHYITQINRYYITAVGGCAPSFDQSWPTIVIFFMWQEIFPLAACYYCVLVIIRLSKYRSTMSAILASGNSRLTKERYLRLFALSLSITIVYLPVSTYIFYVNLDIQWFPYQWSYIHGPNWNSYTALPFLGIRTSDRWCLFAITFAVFLFLGSGSECIDMYYSFFQKIGLARIFPSLEGPRKRKGSFSGSRTWLGGLSLFSKVKNYLNHVPASRKAEVELTSVATAIPPSNRSGSSLTAVSSNPISVQSAQQASLLPVSEDPKSFITTNTTFSGTSAPTERDGIFSGVRTSCLNLSAYLPSSERTSAANHGLQTHIYSPSGYSPHHNTKEHIGSASSETSPGGEHSGAEVIQVKKKLEFSTEEATHGKVLLRDSLTGDVYEAE